MWKVNPEIMCREHLLGEHLEMHMFAGTIEKGNDLGGYIDNNLVEVNQIEERHEELEEEMLSRGYSPDSSLEVPDYDGKNGQIDEEKSLEELIGRCEKCRKRYKKCQK